MKTANKAAKKSETFNVWPRRWETEEKVDGVWMFVMWHQKDIFAERTAASCSPVRTLPAGTPWVKA